MPKNPARAAEILAYGCNGFGASSCALLAPRVDKNPTQAFDHFTLACNRGDKPSCDQAKKLAPSK